MCVQLLSPQLGIRISLSHEEEPLGTGEFHETGFFSSISPHCKAWPVCDNKLPYCIPLFFFQLVLWHWPETCWTSTRSRFLSLTRMSSVIFPSEICCSSTATTARRGLLRWDTQADTKFWTLWIQKAKLAHKYIKFRRSSDELLHRVCSFWRWHGWRSPPSTA